MPQRRRRRRRSDGELFLVTGSRGSGKSSWVMQREEHAPRLLVWDALHEWTREGRVLPVRSLRELHQTIVADIRTPAPAFAFGYIGRVSPEAFETFCALAWSWMRARAPAPPVLVAEELADVTNPGKAPYSWGRIVREGRHCPKSRVYGLTQRPAESDTTIAGNADVIHAGRQSRPRDRKTIAEYLDVPVTQVAALANLQFIERDLRTGALVHGKVTFKH
jgi:hypothetical protein